MSISLVIRCYNEEKYIGRLLSGITQQSVQDVEIIVVDSGSTDSTLSIVSGFPVKLLTITPEEFSFGFSLNIGCEAATRDYIVIASAHVYPTYQDWLERLVAPFADPDVAVAYGKQRGDETSKYSERQLLARWFPDQSDPSQDHPFSNNANSAIRRSLWQKNRYDESLTGLEDLHWANKAMASGYKVAYVAEAEVIHVHNESPSRIYNRYRREAIAMKNIFPDDRFGFWDFVRLFAANAFSDYRQARRERVISSNLLSIFGFRMMQFWGTYRGFARHGPITNQLKRTFYYPRELHRTRDSRGVPESRRRVEYGDGLSEQPVEKQQ